MTGMGAEVNARDGDGRTEEAFDPLGGYERRYVDDPFGNRIGLTEPRPAWST